MEPSFHDDDFGQLYATDFEAPNAISKGEEEEEEEDLNNLDNNNNNDNSVNEDNNVASDSDDDDDFNIVLNNEDSPVGCDEDEDEDKGDDDNRDSRLFFRHKCKRTRGSLFANNMKVQKLASCSFNATHMGAAAKATVAQCGYGLFLPWYWGIFDVNVDTSKENAVAILSEKPWNLPGVDVTDYFNFGFNESTWKLYCTSLEQLWRTSVQTGITADEPAKLNQVAMREEIEQVTSGSVLYPSSDGELPKGRAIQVEYSMVERQPSIDVRHPRSRDSDVIIQIKMLESSDDCSGSDKSIVMDASLEEESIVGNNRNILNYSGKCDDLLSEDQLEDVKKSEDASFHERVGLIPGVDKDEHQEDQHSEDTAEVPGKEIKAQEGGGMDTSSSDPWGIESAFSLGDQEHSLTSYTDSDSEATENNVHVDNEKSLSPLRRQSINSVTDLKDKSSPFYYKNSKNNNFSRKTVDVPYNSRTRGTSRKEWRHQNGRHEPGSNLNKHIRNDNDVSCTLMSSSRDLSWLGHQFVDYDRHKEQRLGFGSHRRRDVSYNRETKQSHYSYREGRERFRENTNQYDRKIGNVRDYFFKPGSRMANRERDWYHAGWRYSADDLSPHSYRESRQFLPKHSSFPHEERDNQGRRMNDRSCFGDRYCNNDFDECEFEFLNKSCIMSTSSTEIEMEPLDDKPDEQFPHTERNCRRSVQRLRHFDRPPLVLDNLWSRKMEDKCQKYTHHQASNFRYRRQSYTDSVRNYAHDARVNENFGGCGRHKHARDNRGSDWSHDFTDAAEDEDFIIYPVEEYQCYRSPSKFLNWTEDEIIYRHHDTHATSLHPKVQTDDIKKQQHQLNMPRRDNENCKIMCSSKGGQAVLKCRKSLELVNREGKSYARNSSVLCTGKLEYVDQGITKKRRPLVDFDKSRKKAIKFDTSNPKSNHVNEKWLLNLQDKGQKESSDIEEGQIVTEEPYIEASAARRDVSEGAALTDIVKERISQNVNNSDQLIGGYDSQRILDSLAKMEKRRERFKQQPITLNKEAEESLKLKNDSVVNTGEMKQHRPVRKRRWVGS